MFKVLWKDYKRVIENILYRMRSYKLPIEDITRATYVDAEQISRETLEIRRVLQQMDKEALEFEKAEIEWHESNFLAVRDWIAASQTETEHSNICLDRSQYQNTGDWILENIQVREWMNADPDELSNPILWINGRPGAGKGLSLSPELPNWEPWGITDDLCR